MLLYHLVECRQTAAIYAAQYCEETAHPIRQKVYRLRVYPDAARIKIEVTGKIILWNEAFWKKALAIDTLFGIKRSETVGIRSLRTPPRGLGIFTSHIGAER